MLKLNQKHKILLYATINKEVININSTADINKIETTLSPDNLEKITHEFKENPEKIIKILIENLRAIATNNNYSKQTQKQELNLYYDAWVDLLIRFDDKVFPKTNPLKVYSGVPDYIHEGLVDMGFNPNLDKRNSREKIYVEKENILRGSKNLLIHTLKEGLNEKQTIRLIAEAIYEKMPLDYIKRGNNFGDKTIKLLEDVIQSSTPKAVCRHHSLTAQVLIQSTGLISRLLKCSVHENGNLLGYHSANLVNVQNEWYLLDITMPTKINGRKKFAFKVPDKNIDTNKNNYSWTNPETRIEYRSKNDMFYRIK